MYSCLKPRFFLVFEPKFQSFKVCVSALLSSLQLLTGKRQIKIEFRFSVILHYAGKEFNNQSWVLNCIMLGWKSRYLTHKWYLISQVSKPDPENSYFWFTLTGPVTLCLQLAKKERLLISKSFRSFLTLDSSCLYTLSHDPLFSWQCINYSAE